MAETQMLKNADATADRPLGLMPLRRGLLPGKRHPAPASAGARRRQRTCAFTVNDFLLRAGVTSRLASLIGAEEQPWHTAGGAA